MKTIIEELSAQALREIRQATKMRERAIVMREQALDTRLRLWLRRLARETNQNCSAIALEHALDAAISVASSDFANIQLVHPTGHGLELKAQRGFSDSFVNYFEYVDDRHTACALALAERRLVIVEDVESSRVFGGTENTEVILEAGVHAVTSAPLFTRGGRVLGVLSVHYRRPRRHVDSAPARLQKLAEAVAALVERTAKN